MVGRSWHLDMLRYRFVQFPYGNEIRTRRGARLGR